MSERKVLNKYYPPDFDPSKIPRMKLPKNRQYTVRLMAPFNMRCKTCGEYIYKGKKFNARKEDVENQDYLGIRIYRFYIKCTRCLQEISFKTDPKNCDYEIEAGATRNFMALKLAEEQAQREEDELKEEEASNPMKLLENRTIQSKNEIELLESLEELKDLNKRHQTVDYDTMLQQYDTRLSAKEIEERLKQKDEEYIKSLKFHSGQKRKVVLEEEIIEETEVSSSDPKIKRNEEAETSDPVTESTSKTIDPTPKISTSNTTWNKSVGVISRKNNLSGLVKLKKPGTNSKSNEIIEPCVSSSDSKPSTSETNPTSTSGSNPTSTLMNSKNVSESNSTSSSLLNSTVTSESNPTSTTESIPTSTSGLNPTSTSDLPSNGLSLLGAYSGSDSENSE